MGRAAHRAPGWRTCSALEAGGSCVPWGPRLRLQSHSICLFQLSLLGEHQILTSCPQTAKGGKREKVKNPLSPSAWLWALPFTLRTEPGCFSWTGTRRSAAGGPGSPPDSPPSASGFSPLKEVRLFITGLPTSTIKSKAGQDVECGPPMNLQAILQ